MPWVEQNKCVGCGACINICPAGAISLKNGKAVIDQDKCTHCGKCFDVCPQEAIRPNFENSDLRGKGRKCGGMRKGRMGRHFGKK